MIIGLSGTAGAGKSTAAEHMRTAHGFTVDAFAAPIIKMLWALNPAVPTGSTDGKGAVYVGRFASLVDEAGWDEAKRAHPEARRLAQALGTDVMRATFGEDVWVNLLFDRNQYALTNGNLAVSDVRFPNEKRAIEERGGTVIRIERDTPNSAAGHASEHSLTVDDFNYVIYNDGTVDDLNSNIDHVLATIAEKEQQ